MCNLFGVSVHYVLHLEQLTKRLEERQRRLEEEAAR